MLKQGWMLIAEDSRFQWILWAAGWQKLRGGTGSPRRKVWTQTKILSPNIHHFFAVLRSVAIYAYFEAFIFAILVIRATFLLQISKYASDERIEGIFALAESLLLPPWLSPSNLNWTRIRIKLCGSCERAESRWKTDGRIPEDALPSWPGVTGVLAEREKDIR